MIDRLPNFLIVGAMKCGTTSLHAYLAEHPQVFVPAQKELSFFDRDRAWRLGARWYTEQFAGATNEIAVGEASPTYLTSADAVERIKTTLPGVRAIVCLREPGARAYSHYLHWREDRVVERRPFGEAVEDELRVGAQDEREGEFDGRPYYAYLARGVYLPQLKRLTTAIDRSRVHILFLEELQSDPSSVFAETCRFLGIDDSFTPPNLGEKLNLYHQWRPAWLWRWMVRHRVFDRLPQRAAEYLALRVMTPRARDVPDMAAETRAELDAHFASANAHLEQWLGRPLPPQWRLPATH